MSKFRALNLLLVIVAAGLAACDNQGAVVSTPAVRAEKQEAGNEGQGQVAAVASNDLGVAIYPGARQDESTTEFIRSAGLQGASFRTSDKLSQVVAFYKSQPGLKVMGQISSEGAMFGARCIEEYSPVMKENVPMGCAVSVTIQSPWLHMTTNEMMTDTLITIGNNTAD